MPQLILFMDDYENAIVAHFARKWEYKRKRNQKHLSKHEAIRKIIREFGAANGIDEYPLIAALNEERGKIDNKPIIEAPE